MPSFRRSVTFTPTPVYSRMPRDDEAYVMKSFEKHASHCDACANPYEVHLEGGTLCAKGHQKALDVAQYVYNKGGLAYSTIDRDGYQSVQVEIPAGYDAVRLLLRAMERGLRILNGSPAVSYDKTYHVSAREIKPKARESRKGLEERVRSPERASTTSPYAGRGSLYAAEMAERERSSAIKPSVYYRVNPEAVRRFSYYG